LRAHTELKQEYWQHWNWNIYQQTKIILKWWCYNFRILEPVSLNIVNHDMNDKGISETDLRFWYNVKVSSQNYKCYVGFEKM